MLLKTMVKMQTIVSSRKGQGLTEYGIIIALIAIVAIAAITGLGTKIKDAFTDIANKIDALI